MRRTRKYIIWIGVIISLIVVYFIADWMLFDGVKSRTINENGIHANYFAKKSTERKTAIVLIGGGQWGEYWGQEFAMSGFIGLSLPYIGKEDLPKLPEAINLEYFEQALMWLVKQPEVDPDKIIVMGASRNAELSLLIATLFPEYIHGVIAYSPSSVSWSNTVLPFSSDDLQPSWKYLGEDIPYVPMDKISGTDSNIIETFEYWKSGLARTDYVDEAAIKVEKIKGPIILFSGEDDRVWPSSLMADMIEKRILDNNFKFSFQNIKYKESGHLISSHPEINSNQRLGQMNINGRIYEFEYGGTIDGDEKAKQDAKIKLMEFIDKI